jgi:hypothetical protein
MSSSGTPATLIKCLEEAIVYWADPKDQALAEVLTAYSDKLMPVPWNDTRVLNEALRMYNPKNWDALAPEQKAPILHVLVAYGQNVIKLLSSNNRPFTFEPVQQGSEEKLLRYRFENNDPLYSIFGYYSKGPARHLPLLVSSPNGRFAVNENQIRLSRLKTEDLNLIAHELGHAIDHAINFSIKGEISEQIDVNAINFFSKSEWGGFLELEYRQRPGITYYAKCNVLEHWAESCAAWVGFTQGVDWEYRTFMFGTHASGSKPGPEGIFSASNLKKLYPLTHVFVDELVRHGSVKRACGEVEVARLKHSAEANSQSLV